MSQLNFEAIGTVWQIDIYRELSSDEEAIIFAAVKSRIEDFDKTYSRFRADSLVTYISKENGVFLFPPDAELLFSIYRDLYEKTNGLFTPLIGNVISDAGYDATYSLIQKKELVTPPAWQEVLQYNAQSLTVKKPVILDFGAGGKGYLVDLVSQILQKHHIFEYCIDAGGDILYKNKTPIRIGLENPENTNQVVGVCTLINGSICGSAGNRRAWSDFTHIINPKTLSSPKSILAVWVLSETAFIADALATCLFFVDAAILAGAYDFQYCIIHSDHSIEKSTNFPAEIF